MKGNSIKYQHLSSEELLAYQGGKLSSTEMNRIERHLMECKFCEEAMIGIDSTSNSLRTAVTLRDLSKKGHKKFLSKKTIFQLVDINTIMILLFLIGLLVFLSVFLIRAVR